MNTDGQQTELGHERREAGKTREEEERGGAEEGTKREPREPRRPRR